MRLMVWKSKRYGIPDLVIRAESEEAAIDAIYDQSREIFDAYSTLGYERVLNSEDFKVVEL